MKHGSFIKPGNVRRCMWLGKEMDIEDEQVVSLSLWLKGFNKQLQGNTEWAIGKAGLKFSMKGRTQKWDTDSGTGSKRETNGMVIFSVVMKGRERKERWEMLQLRVKAIWHMTKCHSQKPGRSGLGEPERGAHTLQSVRIQQTHWPGWKWKHNEKAVVRNVCFKFEIHSSLHWP